ncbi:MAG: hypothetical protein U5K37_12645 [Natrialbaceae archaeon]|nr:hypothetical protein [Natrialbaceae archaeon]
MIRERLPLGETENSDGDENETNSDGEQPDATVEYEPTMGVPNSIRDVHQTLVSPSNIERPRNLPRRGRRPAARDTCNAISLATIASRKNVA